jgi:hypothetical protein
MTDHDCTLMRESGSTVPDRSHIKLDLAEVLCVAMTKPLQVDESIEGHWPDTLPHPWS